MTNSIDYKHVTKRRRRISPEPKATGVVEILTSTPTPKVNLKPAKPSGAAVTFQGTTSRGDIAFAFDARLSRAGK